MPSMRSGKNKTRFSWTIPDCRWEAGGPGRPVSFGRPVETARDRRHASCYGSLLRAGLAHPAGRPAQELGDVAARGHLFCEGGFWCCELPLPTMNRICRSISRRSCPGWGIRSSPSPVRAANWSTIAGPTIPTWSSPISKCPRWTGSKRPKPSSSIGPCRSSSSRRITTPI